MSQYQPLYDLEFLIHRLQLVQDPEVIRHFHEWLDLFEQAQDEKLFSLQQEFLMTRVEKAEADIKAGSIVSHAEFKQQVEQWIAERSKGG